MKRRALIAQACQLFPTNRLRKRWVRAKERVPFVDWVSGPSVFTPEKVLELSQQNQLRRAKL